MPEPISIDVAIRAYDAALASPATARKTKREYLTDVRQLGEYLAVVGVQTVQGVQRTHIESFLISLERLGMIASTRRRKLAAAIHVVDDRLVRVVDQRHRRPARAGLLTRPAARGRARGGPLRLAVRGSDEGGFEEFDESDPSRRSNSAIRVTCAASCADSASICPVSASICTPCVLITSRSCVHPAQPGVASCNAAINSASTTPPAPTPHHDHRPGTAIKLTRPPPRRPGSIRSSRESPE